MELERQLLHRNREIGGALNQITLDDDYNLPDYKPDLTKVIRERGSLHFDEVHASGGHVWFKGVLECFRSYIGQILIIDKINSLKG